MEFQGLELLQKVVRNQTFFFLKNWLWILSAFKCQRLEVQRLECLHDKVHLGIIDHRLCTQSFSQALTRLERCPLHLSMKAMKAPILWGTCGKRTGASEQGSVRMIGSWWSGWSLNWSINPLWLALPWIAGLWWLWHHGGAPKWWKRNPRLFWIWRRRPIVQGVHACVRSTLNFTSDQSNSEWRTQQWIKPWIYKQDIWKSKSKEFRRYLWPLILVSQFHPAGSEVAKFGVCPKRPSSFAFGCLGPEEALHLWSPQIWRWQASRWFSKPQRSLDCGKGWRFEAFLVEHKVSREKFWWGWWKALALFKSNVSAIFETITFPLLIRNSYLTPRIHLRSLSLMSSLSIGMFVYDLASLPFPLK